MKKLFIFYIIAMAIIVGYAKSANAMNTDGIRSYVYCVEGYKFIYTHSPANNGGVNVTQIKEYSAHVGMIPLACDGSEPYRVAYEGIKVKK